MRKRGAAVAGGTRGNEMVWVHVGLMSSGDCCRGSLSVALLYRLSSLRGFSGGGLASIVTIDTRYAAKDMISDVLADASSPVLGIQLGQRTTTHSVLLGPNVCTVGTTAWAFVYSFDDQGLATTTTTDNHLSQCVLEATCIYASVPFVYLSVCYTK
ncbi:uncharacterized protein TRIVIDRAFT_218149 [Trichoderma virens Gv29-8]|uniref:Uncharacterized protein n=1 Tax=Hypocrea virens (strain Gv29-8 / FGSC 10586) TaxID=413071 RepID=G9MGY5_HYPVG|nr:uncharacterized protein TRIVIDRAFT_218149 [Trichoderma virens Gv29-8]EHK25980.1 hypothetical protein TRIVIDRAFT_218149 [Trichoderma virens Gv29-8]UKZ46157.1 hypothetical protein TrVGV298_000355 [Trichoderma virens]UKZ72747.1 hypothetical protein TrVFT333_000381 [Trichoderma virens FT-333]